MTIYKKHDFPVADVRRLLEPGPVVLVSSAYKDQRNIMTLSWHMPMEFAPSLLGCVIAECYANFECKLVDGALRDKYNFFIFEVVKAHAARAPKYPKTIHYRGDGQFMVSGRALNLRRLFRPEML